MEDHDKIFVIVGLLNNKCVEGLEKTCNHTEEKHDINSIESEEEVDDEENIIDENTMYPYQKLVEKRYCEHMNEKVRENEKKLVIKLLREGYEVSKVCQMLELTYSQIYEIVSDKDSYKYF